MDMQPKTITHYYMSDTLSTVKMDSLGPEPLDTVPLRANRDIVFQNVFFYERNRTLTGLLVLLFSHVPGHEMERFLPAQQTANSATILRNPVSS